MTVRIYRLQTVITVMSYMAINRHNNNDLQATNRHKRTDTSCHKSNDLHGGLKSWPVPTCTPVYNPL